jgi:hypothetical protein
LSRHRPKDCQSLGGYLNAALPEKLSRINGHVGKSRSTFGVIQMF